ncbi:glycosyltransferase [Microbacterium gallinarum]|uniref:Colanic acid biosynthesis glycosyltransferase WcaC n=1 Tax=Microbacterium gallinarum TaxID=2762209 RepID=A0ABR8X3P3_9MICO|nr:glycosyltransferase [Microbacterium gallinarum]MBD8023742.1 colanic acid biosynthesis glycosyltransferase WcaC [Microbacterium gallinarum]
MRVKNVLQVNVRLSEGGAAGVARTLADELAHSAVNSRFVYGYGPHGGDSPEAAALAAVRLTAMQVAAVNKISFELLGEESRIRGPRRWEEFRQAVDWADVVHFHAVHSYMANPHQLVSAVTDARKPLVWTMHDQWHFTGRCAQPGACNKFATGCQPCPDLRAYPPARVDRAAEHWSTRRELVAELHSTGRFALVSCAGWLADLAEANGLGPVRTITNSVDRRFWEAATAEWRTTSGPKVRALFICRDLRDPQKVDWDVLRAVSGAGGVELTIIGDNPQEILPNVRYVASTRSREELAAIMKAHDVLVFTSTVDYYPLTLVEALTAGMRVVAVDSQAARELAWTPRVRIVSHGAELASAVSDMPIAPTAEPHEVGVFAPSVMARRYLDVYEEVFSG